MCCTRLAGNAGPKISPKIRPLGTIAQLCRAISSQLRHMLTIGRKLLNSNISSTCLYNMVNFGLLAAEIRWRVLAPSKFERVSRFGSVIARHSRSGRQPNFAVLSRGRHLYSTGRPSRSVLPTFQLFIFLCYQYFLPKHILFMAALRTRCGHYIYGRPM